MAFNPIKEEIGGKKVEGIIWTTKVINTALSGLEKGKRLVANPFYENNTKLLKGDLVFKRTDEENDEFVHCMQDIIYFANNYAKLMTPEGIQNITLRPYQEKYLKHLVKNRLSIYLSCRQSAKCVDLTTNVTIKSNSLPKKYNKYKINDVYTMPMFEIVNQYKTGLMWKIKYLLYKVIYTLK